MEQHGRHNSPEAAVVKTLAYYQALGNMPMTLAMLQRHLIGTDKKEEHPPLFLLQKSIDKLKAVGIVAHKRGFYALVPYAQTLLENRAQYSKNTALKWRTINTKARVLPYVPYVREVGITGSVVLNNATPDSDIDVLITTKKGRIWTTRFLTTAITHVLGVRRHEKKVKDRLCFNHYKTEGENFGPENIQHVVKSMYIPIWKSGHKERSPVALKPGRIGLFLKTLSERTINILAGDKLEALISRLQIKKIEQNPVEYSGDLPKLTQGTKNLLFFYPKVKETERKYKETIKQIIN